MHKEIKPESFGMSAKGSSRVLDSVAKLSDGRITLDSFYASGRYFPQLAIPRTEK